MKTFPKLIHVRIEAPDNDEPFLVVDGSVADINDDGTPIAAVAVSRRYVERKRKR